MVFSYFNEFFRMVVHILRKIFERFYFCFPETSKLELFVMIKIHYWLILTNDQNTQTGTRKIVTIGVVLVSLLLTLNIFNTLF